MRKIRIDKETEINGKVIKWIIEKHKEEKDRISSLREYYNNNNLYCLLHHFHWFQRLYIQK